MYSIFLEKNRNKKSVNTSSGVKVSLVGGKKLLPTNEFYDVVSEYEQYVKERGESSKIRLTCQVNPICSNVLFNKISEIVENEGSSDVSFLNYNYNVPSSASFYTESSIRYMGYDLAAKNMPASTPINEYDGESPSEQSTLSSPAGDKYPANAIRNMELSAKGYIYHCGLDVFNNHLIRSKTFKVVNYANESESERKVNHQSFNTIADAMRDVKGRRLFEKISFPTTASVPNNAKVVSMHVYNYDDIYSFSDCVKNRLLKTFNGWLGFENNSNIKTYSDFSESKSLNIERPIMYMNGGDFVDMYPSRDLYSFVPKYNEFRGRVEKNWNYCITYPSSSTTFGFEDIIDSELKSLKTVYYDENTYSDNGSRQIVMYGVSKHGLKVGDVVNVYKNKDLVINNAKVTAIADDFVFTLFPQDIQISSGWVDVSNSESTIDFDGNTYTLSSDYTYYFDDDGNIFYIINGQYVNLDKTAQNVTYKKVVGGIECKYYVRIFSRLPNFKFASASTLNEYEIYKDNGKMIDQYQSVSNDFESHISKLAFAKNVYSDDVGQIVFTDDIDISNLHDNLGRPLTSLYLTLVKNNKGYKEWYGFNNENWSIRMITSSTVEFSHCFGKISCGVETSYEASKNPMVNCIRKISSSSLPYGFDVSLINGEREADTNYGVDNTEIWYDTDKHYYGDLVCYDQFGVIEQSIQPILHRFNTAQRESFLSKSADYFKSFSYDEITSDDYDKNSDFVVTSYSSNEYMNDSCNQLNEGYFYQPHYEIKVRNLGELNTAMPSILNIRSLVGQKNSTVVTVMQNHFLKVGDKCGLYDKKLNKLYYCTTVSGENSSNTTFYCKISNENGSPAYDIPDIFSTNEKDLLRYKLFKLDNLEIPSYATILKDGTCRLVWRDIVNNGLGKTADEEEYPFTNGAFYINKRVDMYVRRQDPDAIYGLYSTSDAEGAYVEFETDDTYVKEENIGEC